MNMSGNTILITGGSSGIGLEMARQLCPENTVIITGRSEEKLAAAKQALGRIHTVRSDAADPAAIRALYDGVVTAFPALNILINNAGIMRKISVRDARIDLSDISREIETNLSGPIRMAKQFLPHLLQRPNAAIVNVTSGLAFVPMPISPVYSAAKAGLHAFTQALRIQLHGTSVQIFELAPPGTETPQFRGDFDATDLGSIKGMDVTRLARLAIGGLRKGVLEIRPGQANILKFMSRAAPQFALGLLARANAASLTRMRAEAGV